MHFLAMQKAIETVKENTFHKLYLALKHQTFRRAVRGSTEELNCFGNENVPDDTNLRRDDLHVFLGNNFWKNSYP
jgi:hypothetical protein